MNDNEQYRKMYESEEYKAFQIEADAKREALKKEYGKYISVWAGQQVPEATPAPLCNNHCKFENPNTQLSLIFE